MTRIKPTPGFVTAMLLAAILCATAPSLPSADDASVQTLLSQCRLAASWCQKAFESDATMSLISDSINTQLVCFPDQLTRDTFGPVVLGWLTARPELSAELWRIGIDTAARAIWPC
jgi:hypothetical protein